MTRWIKESLTSALCPARQRNAAAFSFRSVQYHWRLLQHLHGRGLACNGRIATYYSDCLKTKRSPVTHVLTNSLRYQQRYGILNYNQPAELNSRNIEAGTVTRWMSELTESKALIAKPCLSNLHSAEHSKHWCFREVGFGCKLVVKHYQRSVEVTYSEEPVYDVKH